MLAFDDSPKAWEALYVATYLAGHWGIPISVLTVEEEGLDSKTVRDKAQTYLDGHGIKADYLIESGEVAEVMLKLARERALDWLLLGGYSASPVVEVVVGSTVEALLRRAKIPMLICR
jgi:nucleotide-binding universal stress UspA family protein